MSFALRVLPTYPWPSDKPGAIFGRFATEDAAEKVRCAMPNGRHYEVIERPEDAS